MAARDPFDWGGGGGFGGFGYPSQLKEYSLPKTQGPEPAPHEDAPTPEMIQANTWPPDTTEEEMAPAAFLSEPKFNEPVTHFHQEAEVSAKLTLPDDKGHITRVTFELFAKTPKGLESICKVGTHAQPDGTAVAKLPVFMPKNHDGGPVEYFFEVTHKLAKLLSAEGLLRTVSKMALKSVEHALVPGASFPMDSSFIRPAAATDLKRLESALKEWGAKYSKKAHIVVYGHASNDEKDGKALSERRAQSAHAFITNDPATWEKLYGSEKWGLAALQTILKDLGHYDGKDNGVDGPKTQAAFKAFQKKAGLTGSEGDAATRKALFTAYMQGKHDIKIEASRFRPVAGHPWMGCAANNAAKVADGAAPENRRVTFILIKESPVFPVHFPCQDGSERACQGQCKREGKRSGAGIKCMFFDELVREDKEVASEEKPQPATKEKSSVKNYDIDKAIEHLNSHAHQKSIHRCATYVRQAIEAGGGRLPMNLSHEYAKEYGPVLTVMGFRMIPIEGYAPQKGDLAVFQPPAGKDSGHVQMFNGTEWVSDFFQGDSPDIYPGPAYRKEKVDYELYRP